MIINALSEDGQGTIWAGSTPGWLISMARRSIPLSTKPVRSGLRFYLHYTFKDYSETQGLIELNIRSMLQDRAGRDRCLAAGMDDYLPKPIRREELTEKLSFWVSSKTTLQ